MEGRSRDQVSHVRASHSVVWLAPHERPALEWLAVIAAVERQRIRWSPSVRWGHWVLIPYVPPSVGHGVNVVRWPSVRRGWWDQVPHTLDSHFCCRRRHQHWWKVCPPLGREAAGSTPACASSCVYRVRDLPAFAGSGRFDSANPIHFCNDHWNSIPAVCEKDNNLCYRFSYR